MSVSEVLNAFSASKDGSIEHLKKEFSKISTGRANPELFEGVMVEAYGQLGPIKNVAQIIVTDARTIMIKPFDRSVLASVEKGLLNAQLGLNPNNNGEMIIINIPPLSEERRKELVKLASKFAEDAKIAVRQARQKAQQGIKDLHSNDEIAEDEKNRAEKQLQEKVDEANKLVDETFKAKEADILKV